MPIPLDWYIQVGALVLASLLLVAVPDSIAKTVVALFSGQPIAPITSTQPTLESGNFAGTELDSEQVQNAAVIINKGKEMGASDRDITIALMAALQESNLRNLDHGDDWWFQQTGGGKSDSLGLFQQRDRWGSKEARLDPAMSAALFFNALFKVGDRDSLTPNDAAQQVQNSAFPDEYAKWQPVAEALLDASKTTSTSSGALQFKVNFASNVSQDERDAVNSALTIWQSKITSPTKTIAINVATQSGEGWLAQAMPTEGSGANVTAGQINIDPSVFGRQEYDAEDKTWIIVHEIGHILGMTQACGMTANTTLQLDGQTVKTETAGHFATGTEDLMTPRYVGNRELDLTMKVLEQCGWNQ
ncbi:MAG TPA: hypothetical protein V6C65_29585 [Allocoleopsis sp.]